MDNAYAAALGYLYSLTNYEHKLTSLWAGELFELGRMERLLDAMGRPDRRFRSVHVAGTKGKGSTAALIESVLRYAGFTTGFFPSPHLHTFRERMQVNGEPISEGGLVAHLERLRPLFDTLPGLTTFEASEAIAFDYFLSSGVQWAVVEVGLGGRLDATNVIEPAVSVITPVSYDHMLVLGDTLDAIAREKAGIIKARVPVVSAPQPEDALNVIRHVADHLQAPLTLVGQDWTYALGQTSLQGQHFTLRGPGLTVEDLYIPLLGAHQVVNAATAVAALHVLRGQGLQVPEEAVRQGLRSVRWPGRLEILSQEGPTVVVDGAHNGESMQRLVEALDALFPGRPRVIIFAALADKDLPRMFQALLPHVDLVIFARTAHPRAMEPEELDRAAQPYGTPASVQPDLDLALDLAIDMAGQQGLVVATGSLSTAAAVREAWARRRELAPLPSDPI